MRIVLIKRSPNIALTELHQESLNKIQEIREEYGVRNGLGSFVAKRRAIKAIRKEVNVRAGNYGIAYDLKGRILNFGRMNVDFLMEAHNPILVPAAA